MKSKNTELDLFDLIEQEVIQENIDKEYQRMIDKLHKKGINYTVFKNALPKNKEISEEQKIFYYKLFALDNFRVGITLEEYMENLRVLL